MTAVVSTRDYTASLGSCISAHDEVVYLILSVTPWGTPMLTVADRTLCRLIFLSAPYSTIVPKKPDLTQRKEAQPPRSEFVLSVHLPTYSMRTKNWEAFLRLRLSQESELTMTIYINKALIRH